MLSAALNNLIYTFLSCLIFFFSGLGLTMLVSPKGLRKYVLFLSPLVGYCYIVLAGWHMSTFGMEALFNAKGQITALSSTSALNFHGTDSYFWLILLPPALFLALSVYKNRRNIREAVGLTDSGLIAPLAVGVLVLVLLSAPLFRHGDGLSVISISNHDIIESGLKSRFLKEFSLSGKEGYLSHMEGGYAYLQNDAMTNRFGAQLAAAFLSSVFSLEAYQLQMIVMNALFFFGILLFYALLREVFEYDRFPALMIAALYGLSPIMYYLVYQGFQPQVVGMTLAVGFFLMQFHAIENSKKFSDYAAYIPVLALFNWGVTSTYAHMLPFIYIPVVAYMAMRAVNDKSLSGITGWAGFQAAVLLLTTVLSPYRMKVIASNLLLHAGLEAGWNMPYFSPDYILGLNYLSVPPPLTIFGYTSTHFEPLLGFGERSLLIHLIFSIPVIIALYAGLSRAFREDRKVFHLSVACLLVIIGGYNYIYLFTPVSAQYKSFKLLSFFLPLVIAVFPLVFRKVLPKSKGIISGYTLMLLVAGNIIAALILAGHSFEGRYVTRDLAEVKKVESMPEVESVNIIGYNWWEIMWQNVFLIKEKQYFQTSTYTGRNTNNIIDGQWDLFNVLTEGAPPEECKDDVIPLNSTYALIKARRLADDAMRADIRLASDIKALRPGQSATISVSVKNTSRHAWPVECNLFRRLHLTYTWVSGAGGKMASQGMGGAPLPRNLRPGEEITIDLAVNAPKDAGKYLLVLDMLQESVSWFQNKGSKPLVLQTEVRAEAR